MNKRKIFIAVIVCVLGGIAMRAGVYTNEPQEKIKVGVLLPLSSDFAWWGDAIKNSIATAQAAGYSNEFEFMYEDTQCNTKDAVSGTLSLKTRYPDMHMFIVGCDNDLQAMIPILDAQKDMAFMVGLSSASLYANNFPVINLAYRLETEGANAAEFAIRYLNTKSLGIIVDNGNFGGTLSDAASKYFYDEGYSTITERLAFNAPNPETSVLKVIKNNPDAVYIQNDIPTIAAILKRLDQFGYKGKRIVYYGGRDQSLIDAAGISAEGVYVPWPISDAQNPERIKFIDTFIAMYKKEPFITGYFVYDGLMLLDEAHAKCEDDTKCVADYFYNKKDFVGTLGKIQYNPDGKTERNFYFQQIQKGKFVEVIK